MRTYRTLELKKPIAYSLAGCLLSIFRGSPINSVRYNTICAVEEITKAMSPRKSPGAWPRALVAVKRAKMAADIGLVAT